MPNLIENSIVSLPLPRKNAPSIVAILSDLDGDEFRIGQASCPINVLANLALQWCPFGRMAGWAPEKFSLLEKSLHKVINRKRSDGKPRITARTSNILVKDYEETLPDDLKNHPECRSYFIINVVNLMRAIGIWADGEGYHETIHYIFADGKESAMKTTLFPFVVLIHAFSMLLGMASLSFLVFTERLSTFLILVLLNLTASLAAPSSKLASCIARTAPRKRRKRWRGRSAAIAKSWAN